MFLARLVLGWMSPISENMKLITGQGQTILVERGPGGCTGLVKGGRKVDEQAEKQSGLYCCRWKGGKKATVVQQQPSFCPRKDHSLTWRYV